MNNEQFQKEKMYQATMSIARNLLKQGIVSEAEYDKIDTMFTSIYAPSLGILFSDIGLLNLQSRANM